MYRLLNWNYWRQRIEDCTNSCQDTTMRSILKLAILFTFKKRPTTYRIEGVNLRTGRQGIFPSAYAVDMDYSDFDPSAPKVKRERYLLGYLGSVETLAHKGTGVVCQAVRRIVGNSQESRKVYRVAQSLVKIIVFPLYRFDNSTIPFFLFSFLSLLEKSRTLPRLFLLA